MKVRAWIECQGQDRQGGQGGSRSQAEPAGLFPPAELFPGDSQVDSFYPRQLPRFSIATIRPSSS